MYGAPVCGTAEDCNHSACAATSHFCAGEASIELHPRTDAHNAFNHPQFSGLGTSLTNLKTFGTVTGAQDPRMLLLVGRLRF
jgi:hypothetical protein